MLGSVVMKRPDGLVVVDPAFSKAVRADLSHVSAVARLVTGGADGKTPTVTGLADAGLDPAQVKWVLITHSHWDHTGGLGDLKPAPIRLSRAELEFVQTFQGEWDHGAIVVTLERAKDRFQPFDFDGPPLLGFDASKDLFGDGSVIALPLHGHTPGNTGYLLRDEKGARWLLIGDAAWMLRGVEEPAHKSFVGRGLDSDQAQTGVTLAKLHALWKVHPEIHVVPAHDLRGYEGMPDCGK
jgi:glyoxylase-like metal-dependent hydrolase (beta-lactamase superfamily II)